MTYTALLHIAEEGGYWATCPEVPGATGQGETSETCLNDLADAVKIFLEEENRWDEQIRADLAAGKLNTLLDEARREKAAGTLRPFP